MTELNETKKLDHKAQLAQLLKEKEAEAKRHEEEMRERDKAISELKISMKEEGLDKIETIYKEFDITPKDLAKRFGFKVVDGKEELEPEKVKSKRKAQKHISFLYIKDGVQYERKSSSPKTFLKEPWKSLALDGDINDHCPLWYAEFPEEEIRVSGKYGEPVKTVKVTRKYFTQAMIDNGEELPDNKVAIERTDNKVIQDVEALKESVRSMLESSK